jgi:hypothetical protein
MATDGQRKGRGWRRLAWFVGIWAASAGAVVLFGWVVRKAIGL